MSRSSHVNPGYAIIGAEIRRLRTARGMSQLALSKIIGVGQMVVSDVESGRRNPYGKLDAVAAAFGVGADSFTSLVTPCPYCRGTGLVAMTSPNARPGRR